MKPNHLVFDWIINNFYKKWKKVEKKEPEPEKFTMDIEEGMEDAAKLIQKKYRSKQKNKENDEPELKKDKQNLMPKKKEEEPHKKPKKEEKIEKKPQNSPGLNMDEEIGEDLNFSGELEDVSQMDIEL